MLVFRLQLLRSTMFLKHTELFLRIWQSHWKTLHIRLSLSLERVRCLHQLLTSSVLRNSFMFMLQIMLLARRCLHLVCRILHSALVRHHMVMPTMHLDVDLEMVTVTHQISMRHISIIVSHSRLTLLLTFVTLLLLSLFIR